ncbi:MAG: ABC transporter ATP-binding protein [Egibacteraceae bacterium]
MLFAEQITVRYDRHGPAAVQGLSVTVPRGAAVGLAGPSGCGKSTLARVLGLVLTPQHGTVHIDGAEVTAWRYRAPRPLRAKIGLIFQQPRLAVDPRLRLSDLIAEPLRATKRGDEAAARVAALTEQVELTAELLDRRPHEVSDGQLQRACLARALIGEARYLVCDEMTSMLDASTQARLVNVVEDYRHRTGAGILAISHDETLLTHWCDHILRPWTR